MGKRRRGRRRRRKRRRRGRAGSGGMDKDGAASEGSWENRVMGVSHA